jgi:hypothetical protein
MTHATIAELADAIRGCYEEATPVEKHRILAEFIAAFGHNKNPRSAC